MKKSLVFGILLLTRLGFGTPVVEAGSPERSETASLFWTGEGLFLFGYEGSSIQTNEEGGNGIRNLTGGAIYYP